MDCLQLPTLHQKNNNLVKIAPIVSSDLMLARKEYAMASLDADTIPPRSKRAASRILPLLTSVSYGEGAFLRPYSPSESLKGLEYKQRALEQEEARHLLFRQERKQRALLVISEADEYQPLKFYHESNRIRLDQENEILCQARARAAEEAHEQRVFHHQEVEELKNDERQSRAQLARGEWESRSFITSLHELRRLEIETEGLKTKTQSAAAMHSRAVDVRERELAVSQISYRPPKRFHLLLTSDPFRAVRLVDEAEEGRWRMHQRETRLAFFEEEFRARQGLFVRYQLHWAALDCLKGAALLALQVEPLARQTLEALFNFGGCQARLAAIVLIQRWWRFVKRRSWSEWRREALAGDLARIPEPPRSGFATPSRNPRVGDDGGVDLDTLSRAAERYRYDIMMDWYLYTLGARVASFLKMQQYTFKMAKSRRSRDAAAHGMEGELLESATEDCFHALSQNTLLGRCRTRFPLPYDSWRRTRWVAGSLDKSALSHTQSELEKEQIGSP
ncbi:unnamed protein product [Phytomonas sp. EM1]|nr:unnamed protein product [Phytomonas sp. EM1]|eukprot:CCW60166.1 unnamed protein product [Phytomonas sp. isolate EM1]